ncbi:MAG: hypothetical protein RLP44_03345 [Aggregatilineales bacterium]
MDYNIYSLQVQDSEAVALTTDGSPLRRRYEWPTWSHSGQLAYFCCNGQASIDVFISDDGSTQGESVYTGQGEAFTYASWSPSVCSTGDEPCYDLGVLISNLVNGQFDVRLLNADNASTTLIGSGAPFYFSWSPDGQRLLTYRNETSLDIYQVAEGNLSPIELQPGTFPAPAWSPVDDRLLVGTVSADGQSTDLVVISDGETQTLAENLNGQVVFNWSPDGNYVAYSTLFQNQVDLLYVVDAISGEVVAQTNFDSTFAFFWSPDSSKLAYLTSGVPQGSFSAKQQASGIAWGILDVTTDTTWRYGSFLPTREMVYMISFFNQFAQSHQIWSPDSSHIVFAEQISNGQASLNILDVTRVNSLPLFIGEGYIGIWSYE